jgi:hypothetical protein
VVSRHGEDSGRESEEIMGSAQKSPEPRRDAGGAPPTPTAALVAELNPNTDLAGLVERVARANQPRRACPYIVRAQD